MSEDRPEPGPDSEVPEEKADVPDKQESLETLPPPDSLSSELDSLQTLPPPPDEELVESWQRKTLAGRFELTDKIGEGGMGVVFRARDLALDEIVAVKVLQRSLTQNADDIRRFKREIKTARRISHPNVIRIHEFGIDQGEAFICMELLTGGDLARRIAEDPPELDEAIDIAIAIADGVAAAHEEGIVHRDLKPHNVLFDDKGVVKLLDFGIARFTSSKTHTAGIIGTPHYMSPEQSDGLPVSTESDVYSLGVLFYELFTGRLPFEGTSFAKLAMAHATEKPKPPHTLRADLPIPVEAVILKALEKEKANRYRNAGELAQALRDARAGELSALHAPVQPPVARRRLLFVLLAAIVLFAAGAVAIVINDRLEDSATPSPTIASSATPTLAPVHSNTPAATTTVTSTIRPTRPPATPTPTPRKTAARTPTPTARATSEPPETPVDVRISAPPSARIRIYQGKTLKADTKHEVPGKRLELLPGEYTAVLTTSSDCGGKGVPEPMRIRFRVKPDGAVVPSLLNRRMCD